MRKKLFTHEQLLEKTEELLLTYGYEKFHLKLLSMHLDGARSTIYSYYKNKEEIVSACMCNVMQRVLNQTNAVHTGNPLQDLRLLLMVYMQESDLHRLLKTIPDLKMHASTSIQENMRMLEVGHQKLKQKIVQLCTETQQAGMLRPHLSPAIMSATFYALIDIPNVQVLETEHWAALLFDLWLNGTSLTS